MQLNAEDGGHRQCILVTNNENGICENVTYERNKRVINGYTKPNGENVEGLHANNLRYYRTAFVGRERTNKNMRKLVRLATDMLCIKEDLYDEAEITLGGRKIGKRHARRFRHGDREMIVVFNPDAVKLIVEHIKERTEIKDAIKVYVFSTGRYAYDDDFADVIDKVELCALPDAIYRALAGLLPERRTAPLPRVDLDADEVGETLATDNYSFTDNNEE